jgi:antitoxin HicB
MSKKHMGSRIDDFLKEEGIFEEAQAQAVKEVVAWQLAEAMKREKISKNKLAKLLKTSRTQVDRLLDPKNDITLGSLQRARDGWAAGDDRAGVAYASRPL